MTPQQAHPITRVLLCLTVAVPMQMFAQSEPAVSTPPPAFRATSAPAQPIAVPEAQLLREDELKALSARNQEPGPEVRGGSLSNEHLTYIVIALAAAVLVLVLK